MYFPSYPETPLRYGDRGDKVETMQAAMNIVLLKYPSHELLEENGIFDHETDVAVRRFQQHVGLKDDGLVGSYTWISIFALANVISEV